MPSAMSGPPDEQPRSLPANQRLRPVRAETGISDALADDAELVEYLRSLQFRGREWEEFVRGLHAYGIARISALLASGAIFAKASKLTKRTVHDDHHRIQDHDREELVFDSVHTALGSFVTKGIKGGGWSPRGGAALKTYFVNACVMSFTDVYKAWRKTRLPYLPEVAFEQLDEVKAMAVAATYSTVDTDLELLNTAMDRMRKDEIDIFTQIVQGYTQEEIAGKLGMTEKAVERKVYRARRRLSELRPANWGQR